MSESFNILEDYSNYLNETGKYNSSAYKGLTENKIDQNELVGIDKDPDAEDLKLTYEDDKVKEQEGYDWAKGFADFAKDLPESTYRSVSNGLINAMDVGVNLAPLGLKMIDAITPGDLSGPQKDFQNKMKDVSDLLAKPREKNNEALESNSGAANFVSMVFQDLPAAVPIYRKLKSIGIPNTFALPISAGVGGSVMYSDDMSLFLNSETMKEFKDYIGLVEGTPEEELYDLTYKAFEGTGLAFAIPGIFKAAKFVKKNIPAFTNPQSTISVGGAATSGVGADKIIDKSLETQDQSSIPGTVNEYGFEKTSGLNNLAVQFLKKSGTKVQDLKKIPGGTGRSVFALDDDKVIKIVKKQRGIRENMNEGPDYMIDSWRPKVFEQGDDFVVVENVARADAQTRSFLKPLAKFNQNDFDNKTSELQEAMEALGLKDFMDYDLAWRDFTAARNWGKTKDGRIVLLDGGALDITTLSKEVPDYVNKDWQEIISGRRKEGMGKFVIVVGAGGQGYRILDNQGNNTISNLTE